MINRTLIAGLASLGVCISLNAHAQAVSADDNVHQERVSFSDLDLTGPSGAKTLMRRLHRAANDVCGRWETSIGPSSRAAVDTCVSGAVDRSVRQINKPMLSALLEDKAATEVASIAGSGR